MKLLATLTDQSVGTNSTDVFVQQRERHAARAVVLMDGKVALLHAKRDDYYKLAGGGVEEGEDFKTALEREILEEVGATIKVTDELGIIVEQRAKDGLLQISHCYIGNQVGDLAEPNYTEKELAEGFEVVWADDINKAIKLVKNAARNTNGSKFMVARDLLFLETARDVLLGK